MSPPPTTCTGPWSRRPRRRARRCCARSRWPPWPRTPRRWWRPAPGPACSTPPRSTSASTPRTARRWSCCGPARSAASPRCASYTPAGSAPPGRPTTGASIRHGPAAARSSTWRRTGSTSWPCCWTSRWRTPRSWASVACTPMRRRRTAWTTAPWWWREAGRACWRSSTSPTTARNSCRGAVWRSWATRASFPLLDTMGQTPGGTLVLSTGAGSYDIAVEGIERSPFALQIEAFADHPARPATVRVRAAVGPAHDGPAVPPARRRRRPRSMLTMPLSPFACSNCGHWQMYFAVPPDCPICSDVRNDLPDDGWDFRTLADVAGGLRHHRREVIPGVWEFWTTPRFGLDSHGWLLTGPERQRVVRGGPLLRRGHLRGDRPARRHRRHRRLASARLRRAVAAAAALRRAATDPEGRPAMDQGVPRDQPVGRAARDPARAGAAPHRRPLRGAFDPA